VALAGVAEKRETTKDDRNEEELVSAAVAEKEETKDDKNKQLMASITKSSLISGYSVYIYRNRETMHLPLVGTMKTEAMTRLEAIPPQTQNTSGWKKLTPSHQDSCDLC
jgi:hypothetical protein